MYVCMYVCMCVCVVCVCVLCVCVCIRTYMCTESCKYLRACGSGTKNISYKQLASEGSCGKTQDNTFCNTRNKNAKKNNTFLLSHLFFVSFYLSFHSMYTPQHWRIGRDLNTRAQTPKKK